MNPIDEVLMSKEAAGLYDSAKWFGKGFMGQGLNPRYGFGMAGREASKKLMQGTAIGTAATAAAGVGLGAKALMHSADKRRDFNAMMHLNPGLEAMREEDPEFFNATYTSLRSMNPTYGGDPVVAGSLMARMMESKPSAGSILMSTMKEPQAPSNAIAAELSLGPVGLRRTF